MYLELEFGVFKRGRIVVYKLCYGYHVTCICIWISWIFVSNMAAKFWFAKLTFNIYLLWRLWKTPIIYINCLKIIFVTCSRSSLITDWMGPDQSVFNFTQYQEITVGWSSFSECESQKHSEITLWILFLFYYPLWL